MTAQQAVPHPDQYFGFKMAPTVSWRAIQRSSSISAAREADRSREVRGDRQDHLGEQLSLFKISSPQNLAKFDWLVEINRRLADPRELNDAEARKADGRRQAVLSRLRDDSLDRGSNGQAIINIVHRLATESTPMIRRFSTTGGADGAVAESRRPAAGDRSLVQDEGHAVRRVSIRTCITSTSATTTTATGSCSRRRRRA